MSVLYVTVHDQWPRESPGEPVRIEPQDKRMPMLFSPTIGAAITAAIGLCGSAARPAAPRTRSTCARSIDTATWP